MVTMQDPGLKAALDAYLAEVLNKSNKAAGYKHDATGTPTTVYGHGPGGVFTFPGVDPQVFNTTIGVESGLIGMLPKFSSVLTDPTFLTVTGVQADVGTEPVNVCDAAIEAGLVKTCKTTAPFGRFRRQTREIYLDRIGQRVDNSDPMNLNLMNMYAGPGPGQDPVFHPMLAPTGPSGVLLSEMTKLFLEFGVSSNRALAQMLFTGNPTNNTAGNGYREFPGFDQLITTGYVDIENGVACPSLDSDIKDFNFRNVDGSDLGISDSDIVVTLSYLYRFIRTNARKMGLSPATWVASMREELFWELTASWACQYMTDRCRVGNNAQDRLIVDANEALRFRDQMREGSFILIDGVRVPVVFDDGITELNDTTSANLNAGEFSSDIYFIPLTVMGGTPVTFMQYFEHGNPQIAEMLNQGRLGNQVFTTNAGAWIWTVERSRLCLFWEGKVEPRLLLRTPQLAGRLQNVKYVPLQHTRQPFPADPYFVDGGITTRTGPSYFVPWQS